MGAHVVCRSFATSTSSGLIIYQTYSMKEESNDGIIDSLLMGYILPVLWQFQQRALITSTSRTPLPHLPSHSQHISLFTSCLLFCSLLSPVSTCLLEHWSCVGDHWPRWVYQGNSHVMSRRQHPTALLPIPWLLHSLSFRVGMVADVLSKSEHPQTLILSTWTRYELLH